MAKKSPNPIDKYVGARVRMRRIMLNMSQEKLGDALDLTFQQVQKYEKGTNRIGASRLSQIATALDISVAELFEPSNGKTSEIDSPFKLLAEPGALRVLKAYVRTADPAVRRAIVNLIEGIAGREPSSRGAVARQDRGKRSVFGARA